MLHTPHPSRSSLRHQGHANYETSLAMCMDRLALDADWHFDRMGLTVSNSFTFRTQSVGDAILDSAFEIVMSSSLPCSKEQAASLIVLSFERDDEKRPPRQVRQRLTFLALTGPCLIFLTCRMRNQEEERGVHQDSEKRSLWSPAIQDGRLWNET